MLQPNLSKLAKCFWIVAAITAIAGCSNQTIPEHILQFKENQSIMRMGHTGTAALMQSSVLLNAPELEEQVQSLTDEIAKASGSDVRYKVHIMNKPLVNLVAVPSGDIFVFTGFLDLVDNRDELAFGLGHEIAHLRLNHSLKKMKYEILTQQSGLVANSVLTVIIGSAAAGAVSGAMGGIPVGDFSPLFSKYVVGPLSALAMQLVGRIPPEIVTYVMLASVGSYSQEQEKEADRTSVIYMNKAGYDPQAAISVTEKMRNAWHP